ncbi:MAG: hypothetical protein LBS88_06345 [Tannerellaceae bacterium]|nr:hypothetical protein [Tannerellaceae bacterium]
MRPFELKIDVVKCTQYKNNIGSVGSIGSRRLSAGIIRLPFPGARRIIPFYTQGVALGWVFLGFQPGKTSGFSLQIKIKRAGTDKTYPRPTHPDSEKG